MATLSTDEHRANVTSLAREFWPDADVHFIRLEWLWEGLPEEKKRMSPIGDLDLSNCDMVVEQGRYRIGYADRFGMIIGDLVNRSEVKDANDKATPDQLPARG